MTSSWRKLENKNGFIYYLNEATNIKQWDHPKFSDIRQRLDDCNYIKYSMYRLALKFRVLQNALFMEEVPLSIIAGVFEKHRLGSNESSLCLESCDLEAVLSDIYFASNKKNHTNTDIDFATELMLNFLYNVFDRDRLGKIQVSSTKLTLAILSNCSLNDLNKFLFGLCSDHNNCITRLRLQALLTKITEITSFLHEDGSYGPQLVNAAVESCFENSPGLVGIDQNVFIAWLEKNQKLLCWIPILHRIKLAEPVIHSVKCTTCKTNPLMGLRYKCMKCNRYTQCQRCFLTGRTSHSHKLSHAMREYCTKDNGRSYNTLIKKLCGVLQCSQQQHQNESTVVETKPLCDTRPTNQHNIQSDELLCNIEPLSSPEMQLQVVIRQLEMQNKELQQILMMGSRNDAEMKRYLEEHRLHVSVQIEKLKILKDYIKDSSPMLIRKQQNGKNVAESTPVVRNGGYINGRRAAGMELFSPIVPLPEEEPSSSIKHASSRDLKYVSNYEYNQSTKIDSSSMYGIGDISTWIGGNPNLINNQQPPVPSTTKTTLGAIRKSPVRELHSDLDEALAKLQQILANNFSLDESLGHIDNTNLKFAVSEVEGMLTSIIDSVESSRGSSIRSRRLKIECSKL